MTFDIAKRRSSRVRSVCQAAACEGLESRCYLSTTFATPIITSIPGARGPLETAHFHISTGLFDLAVATPTAVQTLDGDGTGQLTLGPSIPLPANPASEDPFVTGSFNGNASDIVMLSQNSSTHDGVITYESSDGNGQFVAGPTSAITDGGVGFQPISAATGYFNGDGALDLAVVGKPATGSTLVLAIMISNGNGTFTEAGDYPITASNPAGNITDEPILTGDYGNGFTSIAVFDGSGQDINVFTGAGNGTFTAAAPFSQSAAIAAQGAFTSTVTKDFAVANGDQIVILLGNAKEGFTAQPAITLPGPVTALSTGDYNLDGITDLITNQGILLGNGDGTFQTTPIPLPAGISGGGNFSNTLQTVDLNADGRADFVGFDAGGNALVTGVNTTLAPSAVFVNSSEVPANPGDDVQFTVTVTSSIAHQPTGTVEVFDGTTDLGTATLSNGTALIDAGANLNIGAHSITAVYSGDALLAGSTSTPLIQTILVPTTTNLVSDVTTAQAGNEVKFTATLTANDAAGDVATGSIIFSDGSLPIGTVSLDALGSNVATLTVADLSAGSHSITAAYQGDNTFALSTSNAIALTETQPSLSPVVSNTTIPVAIVTGAKVHGNVTVKLTNNTTALMNGLFSLGIFATLNGDVVGSTEVATFARKLKIVAGKTAIVKVPIKTFPTTLANGSYFLFAQATDPAMEVSNSISGPSVQVAGPFVALGPLTGGGAVKPNAVRLGKTALVTFTMKNYGNIISSTASLGLGLSTDGQTDVISLGNVSPIERILPNHTKVLHIRITIPSLLTAGRYYADIAVTSNGATTHLFGPVFNIVS